MSINDQKITSELCQTQDLIFYPKTSEDAVFIQKKLLALGCSWASGDTQVTRVQECVKGGMLVKGGRMYHTLAADTQGLRCDSSQFNETFLSADQAFMLDLFNKLSARLERIEQRCQGIETRLDGIEAQLAPERLDKPPHLKTSGGNAL